MPKFSPIAFRAFSEGTSRFAISFNAEASKPMLWKEAMPFVSTSEKAVWILSLAAVLIPYFCANSADDVAFSAVAQARLAAVKT